VFFESEVIKNMILAGAHKESEYFCVVSYKLREKIGAVMKDQWNRLPNITNHSVKHFTPQVFEEILQTSRPDGMSFQRHIGHDPISLADKFHPGFSKMFTVIMAAVGYDYKPTFFKDIFYCN